MQIVKVSIKTADTLAKVLLTWKESLSAQFQRQLLHFLLFPFFLISLKYFWFYHIFLLFFFSDSVCSPHGNSLVLIKISGMVPWDIIYHGTVYHFPYLGYRCAGLYLETSFSSEPSKNLWKGMGQQKSSYLQLKRIHSFLTFKILNSSFVLVTLLL